MEYDMISLIWPIIISHINMAFREIALIDVHRKTCGQ